MRSIIFLIILACCVLFGCKQTTIQNKDGIADDNFPELQGDYLGQKKPGMIPEIFAPFLVSDRHNLHSRIEFTPNGREAYFSCYPDYDFPQKICVTRKIKGKWMLPTIVPFSGDYQEGGPVLANQGKRMYFYSKRPLNEGGKAQLKSDIWYVDWEGKKWNKPLHTGSVINSEVSEGFLYPGKNGSLFFTRMFSADSALLMQTDIIKNEFQEPVVIKNIGDTLSFKDPVPINGEDYFIYTKNTKHGKSYYASLLISYRNEDGSWTTPKEMGDMINYGEGRFPSFSPDGDFLFFVSYRTGGAKFFWVDSGIIEYLRTNDLNLISRMTSIISDYGVEKGKEKYAEFMTEYKDYYRFDEKLLSGAGLNLLNFGKEKEALEVFLYNQKLYPDISLVYEDLGDFFQSQGDKESALENFQKFLDIEPENKRVQDKFLLLSR